MKLHSDDILGGSYRIRRKIGAGSFGEIYIGMKYIFNFISKACKNK